MARLWRFEFAVPLLLLSAIGAILAFVYPAQFLPAGLIVAFASLLCALAILFVALRRLQAYALERTRQLEAIQRFDVALSGSSDPDDSLAHALDILLELTHAAAIRLWLVKPGTRTLEFRLHRGLFPEIFREFTLVEFDNTPPGRAAGSKQKVLLADLQELPALRAKGFVELASLPLCTDDQVVGVLDIAARHRGGLDPFVTQLLERICPALTLAVVNAERVSDAEQRVSEARQLWQAGLDVAAAPDYLETLRAIVDRARELIGGEASALCIWDEQKQWWTVQGTSGTSEAFDISVKRIAVREQTVECPVIRFKYRQSHLDVPVLHAGRVVGCLCIANRTNREFSAHEHELLASMAGQAALAIDKALRVEQTGKRAIVTERERLAREIHDTLAQLLGFVSFKTQAARELLVQGRTDLAQEQLDQLTAISQELYTDTRELILGLGSEAGPERDLVPALRDYTQRFGQLSGIGTTFEPDGIEDLSLPPMIQVQLIRVVQEALSNVRKHAQALHVQVRFERLGEFACVTVEDDGQGFDPAHVARGHWPRFGLQSMRERVESVGGTLSIQSAHGQGTRVRIQIPIVYRGE